MNPIVFSSGIPRLLRGRVLKSAEGELFLKTPKGSFPVQLEGQSIPLGEEFAFKFLRHEPGRVILTPLSQWEYWQEALPFLKELPGAGSGCKEWESWIRAAVRQGLPLDKEVLLSLRRWSLTAEKNWGIKVDPEVFAFLLRKNLPVTPGSILLSLYLLFPRVQKEVWLNALPRPKGEQRGDEETGRQLLELITSGLAKATGREESGEGRRGLWTGILRAAAKFLTGQACQDEAFPHLAFYLSPRPEKTAGWVGRGTGEGDGEKGYSFRLTWHSKVLGQVEITGVERKEELDLLIGLERTAMESRPEVLRGCKEIQSYLENRGWKVKNLFFSQLNGKKQERSFIPPRIDGWI